MLIALEINGVLMPFAAYQESIRDAHYFKAKIGLIDQSFSYVGELYDKSTVRVFDRFIGYLIEATPYSDLFLWASSANANRIIELARDKKWVNSKYCLHENIFSKMYPFDLLWLIMGAYDDGAISESKLVRLYLDGFAVEGKLRAFSSTQGGLIAMTLDKASSIVV